MPTFPTYPGTLPRCLSPLNPWHYLLLAYWVYFRPTALKCYLYQADPTIYRTGGGWTYFRQAWHLPASRNLYLMMPLLVLALAAPITMMASWVQGTPVRWEGAAVGMAVGMIFGVAVGMTGSTAVGVAFGVAFGVGGGVAVGVAVGVVGSAAVGMALGMALSVFGLMGGMAVGVAGGIVLGVAFGLMGGMAGGAVLGVSSGMAFGVAGGLRAIIYPVQLVRVFLSSVCPTPYPLIWDELVVLPLPGARKALSYWLRKDNTRGLAMLASVAANPFQRWVAQRVLRAHVEEQAMPLHTLYTLLTAHELNVYAVIPTGIQPRIKELSANRLLLGEISGRWVDTDLLMERQVWWLTRHLRDLRPTPLTRFAGMLYELLDEEWVEDEAFDLTHYRPIYTDLHSYPGGAEIAGSFEALAAFLAYQQLDDLAQAAGVVANLSSGADLIRSRVQESAERLGIIGDELATYWRVPSQVTRLAVLSRAADELSPGAGLIRWQVLEAIKSLGIIGDEIATYRRATSRVNQLAALSRAADDLKDLDDWAAAKVVPPEQAIVRRIIGQWQRLITEAGGTVARAVEAGPLANPYIFGNPVTGDLFVGRDDIMRRLAELWNGSDQRPSAVIYGHRRMGKTSILHNLPARLNADTAVVDFNMQRVGLVSSTGELLYNLAMALYDHLPAEQRAALGEPDERRFLEHNPYTAFDRYLKQIDGAREGRRFLITVDEFELIEAGIAKGELEPRLLDFCRGLIQTYPWFVLAFAGLHTLEQMTRDYWHPLFGSVMAIPVGFLDRDAAWQLITQPSPDFSLDYDHAAVELIIGLTNGQPYLVQLICHGLVSRFNRQRGAPRRFAVADVEAVVGAPEFYRDGDFYFSGLWRQIAADDTTGQLALLRGLARHADGAPLDALAGEAGLTPAAALEALQDRHVVQQAGDHWRFTVELMRRWVARRETEGVRQ